MKEIKASFVTDTIEQLCYKAAYDLPEEVKECIQDKSATEESDFGKYIFEQIVENIDYAHEQQIAICQDTGTAVIFAEVGQDVHISDKGLTDAINEGVRRGYNKGYLRNSICTDPVFKRKNTGDNTPAIIHYEIVPGDRLKLVILPKGGGSENMGQMKMLVPSQGLQGVKDFIIQAVVTAGGNPCPPIIVGVGIGGTMDKVTFLAKKALTRKIGSLNPDPEYANLEKELLEEINATGIGPQGLGGRVTALAVQIEYYPTHITQLPVAVNINCHASRYAEAIL